MGKWEVAVMEKPLTTVKVMGGRKGK